METTFTVAQGQFELQRPGLHDSSPLRAWDAADEYVLDELAGRPIAHPILVNDAYGALAVALADTNPTSVSDSFVALDAARHNLKLNGRAGPTTVSSVEPFPTSPGVIIIKVPRTLSLLEHQLHQIRQVCSPQTRIVGAGMTKHVHTSTLKLFDEIVGPTTTTLARKKARLIHAHFDPDLSPGESPWPQTVELDSGVLERPLMVGVHAGVFAGAKLDIGARALLHALPGSAQRVLDLGCGNGIIGTTFAALHGGQITFVDESYLAVEAARITFQAQQLDCDATFVVDDAGAGLDSEQFDLVLNNPPFHESNTLSDATAWRMFSQARRLLVPGGELRVVGNRHLGYHTKLKRLFGNCTTVSSNRKFVVLSCRR